MPDCARLVGERPRDRLADPPGRVGRELESLAVVELLGRAHQPERALLDQVQERQALVAVVLGDRDDQTQVGLDHLLLGVEVTALDALGQLDLLLGGQQADLADVLEEQLQRVRRHVGAQVDLTLALAPSLGHRSFDLRLGGAGLEVLDDLDLGLLQEAVEILDVGLVEIDLRHCVGDLGEGQNALLLALGDETLDLVEFVKFALKHLGRRPFAGRGGTPAVYIACVNDRSLPGKT